MSTSEQVARLVDQTSAAYSIDRYSDWAAVAEMLLGRGYTEQEAAAILLSKWTRWAADAGEHLHGGHGHSTVGDLEKFLDDMDDVAAQVADLVTETFPGVFPDVSKLCVKMATSAATEIDGAYSVDKARGRVRLRTLAEVAVDVLGWPVTVAEVEQVVRTAAREAGALPPTSVEARTDWIAEVAATVEGAFS